MTQLKNAALALAVLAAAVSPRAQAGEAERAAVNDLVRLVMPKVTYDRMIVQISQQIMSGVKTKDGSPLPHEVLEQVSLAVQDCMPYDEVVGWTADIYQSRFTLDEIGELVKFYKTPVGQKTARLLPEIAAESARRAGAVIPERLPAAMKKHGLGPK